MTLAISPRRVVIAGAVGATGAKLPAAEVQSEYRTIANLEIRPNPDWTAEAILTV